MPGAFKQDISIDGNLRRLRNRAGLSQEQAAAKLQLQGLPVSREILSQMERGLYSIRISVFLALKELYGAEFSEFFENL